MKCWLCNFCICVDFRSKIYEEFEVTVPDSITSWVASAFVISEDLGFGLTTVPAEVERILTWGKGSEI